MSPAETRFSYVVDTSVVVKWFLTREEADLTKARQLRDAYLQRKCALRAPDLLFLEVGNVLTAGRKLTPSDALESLQYLRGLDLKIEGFRWATFAKAVEIASECGITVYDSYFLALALESSSILITADEVFLKKARAYTSWILSLRRLRLPAWSQQRL